MNLEHGAYLEIRSLIEAGSYEAASERARCFRMESRDDESHVLRTLLSTRISLNSSSDGVAIELLDPNQTEHPFLRAELHFVRGLLLYQRAEFQKGAMDFDQAALKYRGLGDGNQDSDRELLSLYNAFIGRHNSRFFALASEALCALLPLEGRSQAAGNAKLLGLIIRQKSYLFQDLGRLRAAYREAVRASRILEAHATLADGQLSRLQAADCALDLGDLERAKLQFEYVVPPIDARVAFPLAYISSRIENSSRSVFSPRDFEVVTPFWLEKHERRREQAMPKEKAKKVFRLASAVTGVKRNSLEGRLIQVLGSGKSTKSLLCERLWPEDCSVQHLDNRLHRLISRVNRKNSGLIAFDGKHYSISERFQVSPLSS